MNSENEGRKELKQFEETGQKLKVIQKEKQKEYTNIFDTTFCLEENNKIKNLE